MKKKMEDVFLKLMFNIVKNYMKFINFYYSELRGVEKLAVNLHDKTEYFIHIRNFKESLS